MNKKKNKKLLYTAPYLVNGIFVFPRVLKYTIKWVKNPKQTPCPQWNSEGSCPLIIPPAPTCKTLNLSCRADALFTRAAGDAQDVCGPQSPYSGRGGRRGGREMERDERGKWKWWREGAAWKQRAGEKKRGGGSVDGKWERNEVKD